MTINHQELEKIISTKQTFADLAYKEYRSSKYGMTFCCPKNFDNHVNVNEICDWEENSKVIYNESTYTFTTFQTKTYISAGGTVPPWAQFEETIYSSRRLQRPDILIGSAPNVPATNYNVVILSAVFGPLISTSASRIFAFVMRDVDGLPEIGNANWLNILNTRDADNNSPAFFGDNNGALNYDGLPFRQSGPQQWNQWSKYRWLEISGGGIDPTAIVNPFLNLRQNTLGPGLPKNGANIGDYIWLVVSRDGTFNFVQSDGSTNFMTISETGNNANSRFNYGYHNNPNVATDGADFVGGNTTYQLGQYGGTGGVNQTAPLASEQRAFVKYANLTIDDSDQDAGYNVCNDDSELLIITVKDKNGAAVKDYDVFIDNTHYGKTDASGNLIVNFTHASVDTKHIINGCKCFTTTGGCNQQKIDIVLSDEVTPVCTNLAIDCL